MTQTQTPNLTELDSLVARQEWLEDHIQHLERSSHYDARHAKKQAQKQLEQTKAQIRRIIGIR